MSLDEKIGKDRGIFQDVDVVRVLDLKESIKELLMDLELNEFLTVDNMLRLCKRTEVIFGRRLTEGERNG